MGDRVSIQFENAGEKSVVLFNHWGGMEFVSLAKKYVQELKKEVGEREAMPLDRLEPNTVMVDFIRKITKKETRIESSLYLGATENDGDNSDNGHHVIPLEKKKK
jgi:hypothetical protein